MGWSCSRKLAGSKSRSWYTEFLITRSCPFEIDDLFDDSAPDTSSVSNFAKEYRKSTVCFRDFILSIKYILGGVYLEIAYSRRVLLSKYYFILLFLLFASIWISGSPSFRSPLCPFLPFILFAIVFLIVGDSFSLSPGLFDRADSFGLFMSNSSGRHRAYSNIVSTRRDRRKLINYLFYRNPLYLLSSGGHFETYFSTPLESRCQ